MGTDTQIQIFATTPQSKDSTSSQYIDRVIETARWSEEFGATGTLVYTDNGIVDPWHVAQIILENTTSLMPLVATQPIYMHPYSVAKKITTLGYLYGRRVWINMVSGGFKNDLLALNDDTPHDDRYTRLVEYTSIITALLKGEAPVTYEGKYYKVKNLKLTPPLDPSLFPGITSSGSSDAGLQAAADIGAVAIRYPEPPEAEQEHAAAFKIPVGVRIGIIARSTSEEAWSVALERFPEDKKGQIAHKLAMKVSDSQWHKQLSERTDDTVSKRSPYWLGPFHNYKTFCPYLVGDYDEIADLVSGYISSGFHTFVLDIPPSFEELQHTGSVFQKAMSKAKLT